MWKDFVVLQMAIVRKVYWQTTVVSKRANVALAIFALKKYFHLVLPLQSLAIPQTKKDVNFSAFSAFFARVLTLFHINGYSTSLCTLFSAPSASY